jgi:hypothetical protein
MAYTARHPLESQSNSSHNNFITSARLANPGQSQSVLYTSEPAEWHRCVTCCPAQLPTNTTNCASSPGAGDIAAVASVVLDAAKWISEVVSGIVNSDRELRDRFARAIWWTIWWQSTPATMSWWWQ